MQNLRALRQRIRSVQNTQKITKAMQMVAGAKLRRSLEELTRFKLYAEKLEAMTQRFIAAQPEINHPLTRKSVPGTDFQDSVPGTVVPPNGLILITSDTGLCGTYNEKIMSLARGFLMENPSAVVVVIGRKGNRMLARLGIKPTKAILEWGGAFRAPQVDELGLWAKQQFEESQVGAWWIAYTRFMNAVSWKPTLEQILPIQPPGLGQDKDKVLPEKIISEPNQPAVLEELLRRYLEARFNRVVLEAFTSEHSARMIAMKNATDNASEMIDHLTLVRNKARQAAITKELIEVVSGAEALK